MKSFFTSLKISKVVESVCSFYELVSDHSLAAVLPAKPTVAGPLFRTFGDANCSDFRAR